MRTTFRIFAAAAAAALGILTSCQEQVLDAPAADGIAGKELVPVTLTASFFQTKVDYAETAEMNLKPTWDAGDKVIGFDENNNNYEFTVASVAADGSATITGLAPANCTLHLIYLCSAGKDDITSGSLSVNYDGQAGDKTMPAVMLADGDVFFGGGDFHFSNAGAVIGIDAVKGVPNGSIISKITVYGDNISAATITLSSNKLALTAGGDTNESISTGTLSGVTVTDGIGTLSEQVLIAVPAGAKVKEVSVEIDSYIYSCALTTPATLAANQYSYVAGKTFVGHEFVDLDLPSGRKWAICNLGANSPEEFGWFFNWGGTTGYVHDGSKWVTAKGNAQLSGGFCWDNAPFNNGSSEFDEMYFNSIKETVCPGGILLPKYDAVRVNWGRSWCMPTLGDFRELSDNTISESTSDYNGTGIKGIVFKSKTNPSKSLFIPSCGPGIGTDSPDPSSILVYWGPGLDPIFNSNGVGCTYLSPIGWYYVGNYRYYGQPIRAVLK